MVTEYVINQKSKIWDLEGLTVQNAACCEGVENAESVCRYFVYYAHALLVRLWRCLNLGWM